MKVTLLCTYPVSCLCPPSGDSSAVSYGRSDSSSAALRDSVCAAHAVPALPALCLSPDRRRSVLQVGLCPLFPCHVAGSHWPGWTNSVCVYCVSGLLDTLEGPNLSPMQRVARDVPELTLNATVRSLGAFQRAHWGASHTEHSFLHSQESKMTKASNSKVRMWWRRCTVQRRLVSGFWVERFQSDSLIFICRFWCFLNF